MGKGAALQVSPKTLACMLEKPPGPDQVNDCVAGSTSGGDGEPSADEDDDGSDETDSTGDDLDSSMRGDEFEPRRQGVYGPVTGVVVDDKSDFSRQHRAWESMAPANPDGDEDGVLDDDMDDGSDDVLPEEEELSRDLISFCKRRLLTLQATNDIGVVDEGCLPAEMIAIASSLASLEVGTSVPSLGSTHDDSIASGVVNEDLPSLHRGWARRNDNGNLYGEKYLLPYLDDIRAMFDKGVDDNGDKLGAARMLEKLKDRNPLRYDLPGENDIKTEISRLYTASRKRKRTGDGAPKAGKPQRLPHQYAQYIEEQLIQTPSIMPQNLLVRFCAKFPDSGGVFTDIQVKTKISAMKKKIKQKLLFQY